MKRSACLLFGLMISLLSESTLAQMMRPPAFIGGIPGRSSMDSIFMQRQQARTFLYREALEELRKNPQAADLPVCGAATAGPCLATQGAAKAPAEPAKAAPVATEKTIAPPQGRRIALLVGNNEYKNPIPPLETPITDVSKIAQVLSSRFGFSTHIVKDASQARIIEELNKIAGDAKPDDYVLLFYAGHGYLMEDIKMGFWIPVDASVKTAKGWISNQDISKMLAAIPANQLILISDSCFSGTLTKEQKVADIQPGQHEEIVKRRSVVVLSSGGDEPVSDEGKDGHSIFAWNLINTLKDIGGVTPGVQVWKTVHKEVKKDYPQEPQYGAVVSAGHSGGGDYIFTPK